MLSQNYLADGKLNGDGGGGLGDSFLSLETSRNVTKRERRVIIVQKEYRFEITSLVNVICTLSK